MNDTRKGRIVALLALTALATMRIDARAADGDLVGTTVDRAKRVTLAETRPAWTRAEHARGDVDADLRLERVSLLLNRTPERQAAFDALLRDQQDPNSPRYHQWLDAAQIGERYGATAADLDALTTWLRSEDLQVNAVSAGRTRIRIGGRSADVARAFDTQLAWFDTGSGTRIGAKSAPRIPAAFAAAVRGVVGLDAIAFRPSHRVSAPRAGSLAKGAIAPAGTTCDSSGCDHVVFPADFARIYGLDAAPASVLDGTGVSIAIVARERVYADDIRNFQSIADLPQRAPQVIVPPGSLDPGDPASTCGTADTPSCDNPGDAIGDQFEATLDVELAGATAPGATIKLVTAGNGDGNSRNGVQEAIEYAIDATPPPAKIISISYLSCEPDNGASVAHYLDDLFAQAAAEGISVLVASGDAGAAGCADHTAAPPANPPLAINVLCSSGYVTCVGGTQFADTVDPLAYWSNSNAAGYRSALGYIPEGAWNEPVDSSGDPSLGSTGGGTSLYVARPDWQTGIGVPATTGRNTPDVSFTAARHDGYFTCMAAQRGSCAVSSGSFHFLVSSGTSASTPGMAGVAALLGQKFAGAQGNLNPRLYALASPLKGVFHDVTVASSGVASCSASAPSLCNNSTPGPSGSSGGLQGYIVTDGYDLATGLGSIAVDRLVANWGSVPTGGVELNQHGLSGSWANPDSSSQGILLAVQPDFYGSGSGYLFGGWFTYGSNVADGLRWYTVQGQVSGTTAILPVYETVGGRLDSQQATTTSVVGAVTLHFDDCSHATLEYSIRDQATAGTMPLTRLLPNVTCTPSGGNGASAGHYLLSGVWADVSGNSGQGLVLDANTTQHVLFGAWYTFAANGTAGSGTAGQRWYTLQATLPTGSQISNASIFESRGGAFDQATNTTTNAVGSASLSFHSCTSATLTYAFDAGTNGGQHGTLELTRLTPAPAGCHL